jgi:hypothetical protein
VHLEGTSDALDNNGRPIGNPDSSSNDRDFLGNAVRDFSYTPAPRREQRNSAFHPEAVERALNRPPTPPLRLSGLSIGASIGKRPPHLRAASHRARRRLLSEFWGIPVSRLTLEMRDCGETSVSRGRA